MTFVLYYLIGAFVVCYASPLPTQDEMGKFAPQFKAMSPSSYFWYAYFGALLLALAWPAIVLIDLSSSE